LREAPIFEDTTCLVVPEGISILLNTGLVCCGEKSLSKPRISLRRSCGGAEKPKPHHNCSAPGLAAQPKAISHAFCTIIVNREASGICGTAQNAAEN